MSTFQRHFYRDQNWSNKNLNHLRWNTEGHLLAALGGDKYVRIGQVDSSGGLSIVQTIPTNLSMIQVCWHPSEANRFALCSDDKVVEFWDMRGSKPSMKISALGGHINMSWSPSGHYLALSNKSDYLAVFDVRTGTMVKKKKVHYELNEVAWTSSSQQIVAAVTTDESAGGAILLSFDQDDLKEVDSLFPHCASCYYLESDRSQQVMALGSQDHCVTLWDLPAFECKRTLFIDAEIRSMSFSGDGKYLALATEDPSILICETEEGEAVAKIPSRSKASAVSWNPRLPVLALTCEDKSVGNLRLLSFPSSPN